MPYRLYWTGQDGDRMSEVYNDYSLARWEFDLLRSKPDCDAVLAEVESALPVASSAHITAAFATGHWHGVDFKRGFVRHSYSESEGEWMNHEGETAGQYVFACMENFKQYSPWEETASFWNSFENADELWTAFENGLSKGATEGEDSGD